MVMMILVVMIIFMVVHHADDDDYIDRVDGNHFQDIKFQQKNFTFTFRRANFFSGSVLFPWLVGDGQVGAAVDSL